MSIRVDPLVERWAGAGLVITRAEGITTGEVASALVRHGVVAAVQDGAAVARPGAVVVHVGVEREGRARGRVASDSAGALVPGPTRLELGALLARELGADVSAGRRTVARDGTTRPSPRDGDRDPQACRTVYAWQASEHAAARLLPLATFVGAAISHVETSGWIVAWPARPTARLEPRPGLGGQDAPWCVGWHMGDERGLIARRPGERPFVVAACAPMQPVAGPAPTGPTEAHRLATLLSEPAHWNGAETGVRAAALRDHGPAVPAGLHAAAFEPTALLPTAAAELGLPPVVHDVLEGTPPDGAAQTVPARGGFLGAAVRTIVESLLERPRGTGPLASVRSLFWEVPTLRLVLGTAVALLGIGLILNQRTGQLTYGTLEWAMVALFLVFGAGTVTTGTALLLRRRRRS